MFPFKAKLAGSNSPVSHSSSQVQVKLPKINVPTFDGNVLSWQPHYQSIKVSVVGNPSLADVQQAAISQKEIVFRFRKNVQPEKGGGLLCCA